MKRLPLLALVAVAACASQTPEPPGAEPSAPNTVVLATFVADADPGTGTIRFHVEPTPIGRVMGGALVIPDGSVSLHSTGVWTNRTDKGCSGIATWGAEVYAQNGYASPEYLTGIHAEITDFTGGGGNTPCNGLPPASVPAGIDGSLGVWYLGMAGVEVTPGVGGSSPSTRWAFAYVSGTSFTFRGRVLGVNAANLQGLSYATPLGRLRANGSTMAYTAPGGIGFLDAAGTQTFNGSVAESIADNVVAIAPDPGNSRIWFLAGWSVGFTDGKGTLDRAMTDWENGDLADYVPVDIVRDPSDGGVAWMLVYRDATVYAVARVTWTGTEITVDRISTRANQNVPTSLVALGSKLYVSEPGAVSITIWDTGGSGALAGTTYAPTGVCADLAYTGGNMMLAVGPDGQAWFPAKNAICKVAADGTFATVATPLAAATTSGKDAAAQSLCVGSDGEAWYLRQEGTVRVQVTSSDWTLRGPTAIWLAVTSSADGTRLVAADSGGNFYNSGDSGVTWLGPYGGPSTRSGRTPMASSADGTRIVFVTNLDYEPGDIYTSADSGVTWTQRTSSDRAWNGVASSADGKYLVATAGSDFYPDDYIYTSSDYGETWTARGDPGIWFFVVSSADGSKLLASASDGTLYGSSNFGVDWEFRSTLLPAGSVLASSSDGTKIVAGNYGTQRVYTSSDSGATWTARGVPDNYYGVASSSDGTRLVAVSYNAGRIYTSADSGETWAVQPAPSPKAWRGVASSASGAKLVAFTDDQLYTAQFGSTFWVADLQTSAGGLVNPATSCASGTAGFWVAEGAGSTTFFKLTP